jgi:hypothetical protein
MSEYEREEILRLRQLVAGIPIQYGTGQGGPQHIWATITAYNAAGGSGGLGSYSPDTPGQYAWYQQIQKANGSFSVGKLAGTFTKDPAFEASGYGYAYVNRLVLMHRIGQCWSFDYQPKRIAGFLTGDLVPGHSAAMTAPGTFQEIAVIFDPSETMEIATGSYCRAEWDGAYFVPYYFDCQ